MDSLSVRLIKNSVVYPTIRVASHPGKLLMGVYDEDDSYVDDTALNRRSGEQGAPVPRDLFPVVLTRTRRRRSTPGRSTSTSATSCSRAWPVPGTPIGIPKSPLSGRGNITGRGFELRPWQAEILDILEIKNPTRIVADPARFDLLHVPDLGYRYDDRFHPEHAEFLGRYEGPAQAPTRRLWLSRSNIGGNVRNLNSEPTERRLAHAGWTIAHPERLSIREQLDHLGPGRGRCWRGRFGVPRLGPAEGRFVEEFHILRRHGREHPNMHTIGNARQIDQTFYSLERERVIRAARARRLQAHPQLLGDPRHPRVRSRPPPIRHGSAGDAILQRVLAILEPRRFLDVGASAPHLVVGSTAPTRRRGKPVL